MGTLSYAAPDLDERFEIPAAGVDWGPDDVVVLIATDAAGNTSEFSPTSGELGDQLTAFAAPTDVLHTDVAGPSEKPSVVSLSPPYPNPFNPQARFDLSIPDPMHVRITVHDMLGRQVAELHDGLLDAHVTHAFTFDGSALASGTYLLRVQGAQFVKTQRLTLLK